MKTSKEDMREIVHSIANAKDHNRKTTFLIGAGCSATGEVPLAAKFISIIKERYEPRINSGIDAESYMSCMSALTPQMRRELIQEYIDSKVIKVNWAHICLASLMKNGYVGRVLTTNFDPLLIRACQLLNFYPAVYDMGVFTDESQVNLRHIHEPAILYMHGQATGFEIKNTEKEINNHLAIIKPVIENSLHNTPPWLIIGYSGQADDVLEAFGDGFGFTDGLYWIAYKDNTPGHKAQKLLESPETKCVYGYDADSFFIELANELNCIPDTLISKPFTHLRETYSQIAQLKIEGKPEVNLEPVLKRIDRAIIHEENVIDTEFILSEAVMLLVQEKPQEAREILEKISTEERASDQNYKNVRAWACITEGNLLVEQAKQNENEEADKFYKLAAKKYHQAIIFKPDMHEAFTNWGITLSSQAELKSGKEADNFFGLATKKFQQAIKLEPNFHEAFYNWGGALARQAKLKDNEEACSLLGLAIKKYQKAIKLKSDDHEAFYNWGIVLANQAKLITGEEAYKLFELANEKYQKAINIKPDMYVAFYNWGSTLGNQAELKDSDEAYELYKLAIDKYQLAIKIKPDYYEAFNNWGSALHGQARLKDGDEAYELYKLAIDKYQLAIKIKPDLHDTFFNWGIALAAQARLKTGEEAYAIFKLATEKYQQAIKIKPDYHMAFDNWSSALLEQAKLKTGEDAERILAEAHEIIQKGLTIAPHDTYNLACWCSLTGDKDQCREALLTAQKHGTLPDREHLEKDTDMDNVRNEQWFKDLLDSLPKEKE